MKKILIGTLGALLIGLAGTCYASPEFAGEANISSNNDVNVNAYAGGEAHIKAGIAGASYGNRDNTRTNVGGLNVKNVNVKKGAKINVSSTNKGKITNSGTDVNVGGVNLDGN